jgi:hypothetical protein
MIQIATTPARCSRPPASSASGRRVGEGSAKATAASASGARMRKNIPVNP